MSAQVLWTAAEARAATDGMGPGHWRATGVSIDSRSVAAGDLFAALSGPNHDGHDFVAAALRKGAAAALVSRRPEGLADDAPLLLVEDTLEALRGLAAAARKRTAAGVFAITGSSGKTSSKELLAGACAALGSSHAAVASYNNHWGVPLTLARMPRDVAWAVCEIGMNHAGEIRPLAQLVRPHAALVTNVGLVHLEHLGSREAIADAKAEIFEGLEPGGKAILPRGDDFFERLAVAARARGAEVVSFGAHPASDVRLLDYRPEGEGGVVEALVFERPLTFRVPFAGRHQAFNALGVLAALQTLGGDLEQAAKGLAKVEPLAGRGARRHLALAGGGSITLLDESYNANPQSVAAALAVLGEVKPAGAGRRIAVLGDMLELGPEAGRLHAEVMKPLVAAGVSHAFLCGPLMEQLAQALPRNVTVVHAADSQALAEVLMPALGEGDVVLVKGSLGSRMQRIVDALKAAGTSEESRGGGARAL